MTKKKPTNHGLSRTEEYNIWSSMKQRCFNKNRLNYKNYGGRGIIVCKRWLKFENFFVDMGKRPKGKSVDRIDNNGNYEPNNCKWSTQKEQCRNTRNNVILTFCGVTKCVAEWSEFLGLDEKLIRSRLKNGWSIIQALTK